MRAGKDCRCRAAPGSEETPTDRAVLILRASPGRCRCRYAVARTQAAAGIEAKIKLCLIWDDVLDARSARRSQAPKASPADSFVGGICVSSKDGVRMDIRDFLDFLVSIVRSSCEDPVTDPNFSRPAPANRLHSNIGACAANR